MAIINQKTIERIRYLLFSLGPSSEKQKLIELPLYCLNRLRLVGVLHEPEKLIQDASSTFKEFSYVTMEEHLVIL